MSSLTSNWTGNFTQAVVRAGLLAVARRWGPVVHVGLAVVHLGRLDVAPRPERLCGNHSETVVIRKNGKNWFRPLYADLVKVDNL